MKEILTDTWRKLNQPIRAWHALAGFLILALVCSQLFVQQSNQSDKIADQQARTDAIVAQLAQFQVELRNKIVRSCQKNGNPLRQVEQDQLRQSIQFSENKAFIRLFFPDVPQETLDPLIAESIARDKAYLKKIAPVDCGQVYPIPPGSGSLGGSK